MASIKGYAATACVVRNFVRQLCASDIDQIPGAADIHATNSSKGSALGWIVPCAIGVVLLGGVAFALRQRTRNNTAAPAESNEIVSSGAHRR